MKSTVPILLWLFHTALLTFENTLAECALHFGRILHELFNWNIIRFGDKLKGTDSKAAMQEYIDLIGSLS